MGAKLAVTELQLLGELEEIIRSQPPYATLRHNTEENRAWTGRAVAAVSHWNAMQGAQARAYAKLMRHVMAREANDGLEGLLNLLQEAYSSVRLSTIGPVSTAIGQGLVFQYFDEIRKIIAGTTSDLLFVDPYLDADFVSRYLHDLRDGVSVRLLARERLSSLLPAVEMLAKQGQSSITVKSAPNFHDRYLFVDGKACYQSGASFKDGARNAPTTITQITDAFAAVWETYEAIWQQGQTKFPPI